MIVLDTETTHLVVPDAAPIDQQPYILEFAAIKLDGRFKPGAKAGSPMELVEVERMEFMCRPKIPIPPESVKITGITDAMVANCKPFVSYFPALVDFFLGERTVVAHNLAFDLTVLRYEIQRLGRVTAFPWPPDQVCTVERTLNIKGYRMNLGDLHREITGKEHKDAHRAMADVEGLVQIVVGLRKKGLM